MTEVFLNLQSLGYRFVFRPIGTREYGPYVWVHPAEVDADDIDLTDCSDAEFEGFVRSR